MKRALFVVSFSVLLIIAFVLHSCTSVVSAEIIDVTPSEAAALVSQYTENPAFIVLDIRTPEEYYAGHLDGSINIDFYASDFREQINRLDKDKSYLVYCRTGNRSGKALDTFKELGFRKVYHLTAGIVGWQSAGLTVVR